MAMAVSNQQSRDAALVRATTELFVLESTHDADEIRRFEELATHFLPRVSAADRAFVAERLSRSADAPPSILRQLGKDLVEIASPILKRSPALREFDFLTIMAATGHAHHRLIATRTDLSPLVVAALRLSGDAEVHARLAAYPQVMTESESLAIETETIDSASEPVATESTDEAIETVPPSALEDIVETAAIDAEDEAEHGPEAAITTVASADWNAELQPISPEAREIFAAVRALAASFEAASRRPQVEAPQQSIAPLVDSEAPAPVADLSPPAPEASEAATPVAEPTVARTGAGAFLDLDRAGRLALLQQIASQPASPRGGATIIDADHAFRLALGRARLASLARQRQRDSLIRTLAQGLRLPERDVTALMDDPSGEPLIVLLRAIGLPETEAQQVLLFANPVIARGVESFERLAQLFGETAEGAADALVSSWRSDRQPAAMPVHAPLFADLALRRGVAPGESVRPAPADAGSSAAEAAAQEPPGRHTFGLRGR